MSTRNSEEGQFYCVDNEATGFLSRSGGKGHTRRSRIIQLHPIMGSLVILTALVATGLAGYFFGRLEQATSEHTSTSPYAHITSQQTSEEDGMPFALKPVINTFRANRTFLQKPSPENDELWKTLYPKNHGLFEWPDESPERAGFAAFHQLHCVDALRKAWYIDQDIKTGLARGEDVSKYEAFEPDHVLHCVEFLRQSVMCHTDTTIQTELSVHRGIMAFGVDYQCRDWFQLVKWVDDRNIRMFDSAESW